MPRIHSDAIIRRLGHTTIERHDGPSETHRALEWTAKAPYEALSYCWGDVDEITGIELLCPVSKHLDTAEEDTVHVAQRFRITLNLEAALRALRYRTNPRSLWVDAIYIDQGKLREKTHQVGMMNIVYSSAHEVIVWLGIEDLDSQIIVEVCRVCEKMGNGPCNDPNNNYQFSSQQQEDFVSRLFKKHQIGAHLKLHAGPSGATKIAWWLRGHQIRYHPEFLAWRRAVSAAFAWYLAMLDRFLSRSWFHRVWVLHEVMLATSEKYGVTVTTHGLAVRLSWKHQDR